MGKACEGEGLPRLKSCFEFGYLFIMKIEFPTSLDPAAAKALMKALPPPKHVPTISEDSDDVDVCVLKSIDPVQSFKEHQDALPDAEEDDEQGGDGQRVQCAQQ